MKWIFVFLTLKPHSADVSGTWTSLWVSDSMLSHRQVPSWIRCLFSWHLCHISWRSGKCPRSHFQYVAWLRDAPAQLASSAHLRWRQRWSRAKCSRRQVLTGLIQRGRHRGTNVTELHKPHPVLWLLHVISGMLPQIETYYTIADWSDSKSTESNHTGDSALEQKSTIYMNS